MQNTTNTKQQEKILTEEERTKLNQEKMAKLLEEAKKMLPYMKNKLLNRFKEENYIAPDIRGLDVVLYKPHGINLLKGELRPPFMIIARKVKTVHIDDLGFSYRLVPNYKNIAVNIRGDVIDIETKTTLKQTKYGHYKVVSVYNYVTEKHEPVGVHRLVALAWVPNNDYITKNLVDHKDRNKLNNHANNLEWVSASTNIARASNDSIEAKYLVKHIQSGKIYKMESLRKIGELIGVDHRGWQENRLPLHIRKNNNDWIIESKDKFTNWSLENKLDAKIYPYRIHKDGKIYKFKHLREVYKFCNIPHSKENIEHLTKEAKKRGYKVEVLRHKLNRTYDVKNIKTSEVVENLTLKELIDHTNAPRSTVLSRINPKYKYGKLIGDYLIKLHDDPVWPEIKESGNLSKNISVKFNGEVRTFSSKREAARELGVNRSVIEKLVLNVA